MVAATIRGTKERGLLIERPLQAEATDEGFQSVVRDVGPATAGEGEGVDPGAPLGLGRGGLGDGRHSGGMRPGRSEEACLDRGLVGGEDSRGAQREKLGPTGLEEALTCKVRGGKPMAARLLSRDIGARRATASE
jgi:hypothetical protein